jgi:hypothetical protein
MKKLNKKAQLGNIESMITALVVVGLVLVVGFLIIAEVQDQIVSIDSVDEANLDGNSTSYGYNASQDIQSALETIPGWLPIIVIVVIGSLLIGLVSFLKRRT